MPWRRNGAILMPCADIDPLLVWGLFAIAVGQLLRVESYESGLCWLVMVLFFFVVAVAPLLKGVHDGF